MNYYRRYLGDYGKKTALLSMIEHGAYGLLLDHYYAHESALPIEMADLYRIARAVTPSERKAVNRVVELFFRKEPDGFHNERADEEIARAKPAIEAAKENGKKGGRPPKDETQRVIQIANPVGLEGHRETEPTGKAIRAGDPSSNQEPQLQHSPKPERGEVRATRLQPDWMPSPAMLRWAAVEAPSWSAERVRSEVDKFRDYWIAKAGKDATKRDWDATWRNWVRKAIEQGPRPSAKNSAWVDELIPRMSDERTIDGTAERLA